MTNNMTRTKTDPKPALGIATTAHIANQYTTEFMNEKGDHIPMFDPRDEDVLDSQIAALFDARDEPPMTIWR
jgi:hypothetical protein